MTDFQIEMILAYKLYRCAMGICFAYSIQPRLFYIDNLSTLHLHLSWARPGFI